jgi:hypothetical protein
MRTHWSSEFLGCGAVVVTVTHGRNGMRLHIVRLVGLLALLAGLALQGLAWAGTVRDVNPSVGELASDAPACACCAQCMHNCIDEADASCPLCTVPGAASVERTSQLTRVLPLLGVASGWALHSYDPDPVKPPPKIAG